jgi:hypothetical protein
MAFHLQRFDPPQLSHENKGSAPSGFVLDWYAVHTSLIGGFRRESENFLLSRGTWMKLGVSLPVSPSMPPKIPQNERAKHGAAARAWADEEVGLLVGEAVAQSACG